MQVEKRYSSDLLRKVKPLTQYKIMKATTLIKRLQHAAEVKKVSKSSNAYRLVMEYANGVLEHGCNFAIRPCHTSGRGRYTTNIDRTSEVCWLLDVLGVKFETGNDSPRGGKTGNFIRIVTDVKAE
jgi:hypothetical protein